MQESLNEKLQRVESSLTTIKNNLHFEANAVIEDVAASTDIKRTMNLYIQNEEPANKEGIWIQADKDSHPYDKIIADDDIEVSRKWKIQEMFPLPGITASNIRNSTVYGDKIYTRVQQSCKEVDMNTGKILRDVNIGYDMNQGLYAMKDGRIVTSYSSNAYVLVPGESKHRSYSLRDSVQVDCFCSYNNSLYYGYTTYGRISRFDIDAEVDNYLVMNLGTGNRLQKLVCFDRYLIVIGGASTAVYDVSKNYSNVSIPTSLSSLSMTYATGRSFTTFEIDHYLYMTNGMDKTYRINKNNFELETVNDFFYDDSVDNIYCLVPQGNNMIGLTWNGVLNIIKMPLQSKEYDSNAVLISQAPMRKSPCQTQLWDNFFLNRFLYSFYDVYYYNTETGIDNSLPTYYGDGEKWIKFKN